MGNTSITQIIIDTDPGVDDALAIFLGGCSGLNIAGFTTTFGNGTIQETTLNLCSLLGYVDVHTPIYRGAELPLKGFPTYASSHGKNALGGFKYKGNKNKVEEISAKSFIANKLADNLKTTLVCIGPLTNVASVVKDNKTLENRIEEIIILGGVFGEAGNISPYAEFNAFNDPSALDSILKLNCKKVMIPANVCRKVVFTSNDFKRVNSKKNKKLFQQITENYIEYYTKDATYGGFSGGVMYDLLAVTYLMKSSLFKYSDKCVEVNTTNGGRRGETTIDSKGIQNITVIEDVDSEGIKTLFFDTINRQ